MLFVLLHHNNVFDSDSEFSIVVIARLIRHTHAFDELLSVTSGDSLWSFVDAKKTTNSMTSSMLEVKTNFEKMSTCQDVEVSTVVASFWPDHSFQVEGTHKYTSVAALLEFCWWLSSKVSASCYISSSIKILTSRVQKVDLVVIQRLSNLLSWSIMNNSSIRTNTRNRLKTWTNIKISLSSIVSHNLSALILIETMILFGQLFLKEGKILHYSGTIPDITIAHTLLLNPILACFEKFNNVVILSNYFKLFLLEETEESLVALRFINTDLLVWQGTSIFSKLGCHFVIAVDLDAVEMQMLSDFWVRDFI